MKPFNQHPDVLAMTASINEKSAALEALRNEEVLLRTAVSEGQPDQGDAHVAAALEFGKTGVLSLPSAQLNVLHERHLLVRDQIDAVMKSINADRSAMLALQSELSAQASAEVRAEHKGIVADAVAALEAFDAACQAEQELVGRLGAMGFDAHFTEWAAWSHVGRLAERSEAAIWHHHRALAIYAATPATK